MRTATALPRRRQTGLLERRLGDAVVLVDPHSDRVHQLEGVAAQVWLAAGTTVESRAEVQAMVRELQVAGLLEVRGLLRVRLQLSRAARDGLHALGLRARPPAQRFHGWAAPASMPEAVDLPPLTITADEVRHERQP